MLYEKCYENLGGIFLYTNSTHGACRRYPRYLVQVLYELQRDWARQETYKSVMEIVKEHGSAYGIGVLLEYFMRNLCWVDMRGNKPPGLAQTQ